MKFVAMFGVGMLSAVGVLACAAETQQPQQPTETTEQEVRKGTPPAAPTSAPTSGKAADAGGADRCTGRSEAECSTMNACRAAYVGRCDCTCSTFKAADGKTYEVGGGCAKCAASCFGFVDCVQP